MAEFWALYFTFFFFQAEDGIRDGRVTGVQTCALPISRHAHATARAEGARHVLDDAEHGHLERGEHLARLARFDRGEPLRLRDDDRARHLNRLHETERHIAGAGWEIDDENVELGPEHAARELLHGLRDHRSAPDRRRALAEEEAEADEREPVCEEGHDVLLRRRAHALRAVLDPEENRHARPV